MSKNIIITLAIILFPLMIYFAGLYYPDLAMTIFIIGVLLAGRESINYINGDY